MDSKFKYGQVWLVSGHESVRKDTTHIEKKTRPMLIVSNNRNNAYSPILNMIPLTSSREFPRGQYQIQYYWENSRFPQTVLCEQITTVNKDSCLKYLYTIAPEIMEDIKIAMKIQLNL